MKNQKRQAGFTLIELMIVIAIIGILMAYAIPAYRDYTVRAKFGECAALAGGLKTSVAEYRFANGSWPTEALLGYAAATDLGGEFIASTSVTAATGAITATFKGAGLVDPALDGLVCVYTPTLPATGGTITWACTSTVANKYTPRECAGA